MSLDKHFSTMLWVVLDWYPKSPDLTSAGCTKAGMATFEDAWKAERVVSKVSESKQVIRFWNLGDIEKVSIYGAADSSWGKMNNLETVIGHFLFLVGVNGKSNVLDWSSNKLQIPSA